MAVYPGVHKEAHQRVPNNPPADLHKIENHTTPSSTYTH